VSITLGKISLSRLEGVHPNLVRVVKRAALIATPAQDFMVIQGLRTREEMCVNYGKGRTAAQCIAKGVPASYAQPKAAKVTWLNNPFASNHGKKVDGWGHAVDLGPYPLDWNDAAGFKALAALMFAAAQQEAVSITWGGSWQTSPDLPHYELA
jgi:peptidoglycan L-alanyl-D-glutamate endopeptidase CwlK